MRVLILIDEKNFEQGVINLANRKKDFRYVDFNKIKNFIMDYLKNNLQYKDSQLQHLRTYHYTGEYTDKLIEKIEKELEGNPQDNELKNLLDNCKKRQRNQSRFFMFAKSYYFYEIKAKPLQFSPSSNKIFQKGIDVQLAADLVDFTHKDLFDIAVLLSGDIDLLESIKITKNEGKHVIIFGDYSVTAAEMKKCADMFIDIGRFTEEQLDKFTHTYVANKEEQNVIVKDADNLPIAP